MLQLYYVTLHPCPFRKSSTNRKTEIHKINKEFTDVKHMDVIIKSYISKMPDPLYKNSILF
jgi:hypothetical protein